MHRQLQTQIGITNTDRQTDACVQYCAHTHTHTHTHTRAYTDMRAHTHTPHMHIHACIHTNVHAHTCMHIHPHAPTHAHTHTHMRTHKLILIAKYILMHCVCDESVLICLHDIIT